jgi:hypothetical protein
MHLYLTKVANMNPTTYRCEHCYNLYDVTLGEVSMPKPAFGTEQGSTTE